jgi:hypothetical protein
MKKLFLLSILFLTTISTNIFGMEGFIKAIREIETKEKPNFQSMPMENFISYVEKLLNIKIKLAEELKESFVIIPIHNLTEFLDPNQRSDSIIWLNQLFGEIGYQITAFDNIYSITKK